MQAKTKKNTRKVEASELQKQKKYSKNEKHWKPLP